VPYFYKVFRNCCTNVPEYRVSKDTYKHYFDMIFKVILNE
jgi:hypothetical protein